MAEPVHEDRERAEVRAVLAEWGFPDEVAQEDPLRARLLAQALDGLGEASGYLKRMADLEQRALTAERRAATEEQRHRVTKAELRHVREERDVYKATARNSSDELVSTRVELTRLKERESVLAEGERLRTNERLERLEGARERDGKRLRSLERHAYRSGWLWGLVLFGLTVATTATLVMTSLLPESIKPYVIATFAIAGIASAVWARFGLKPAAQVFAIGLVPIQIAAAAWQSWLSGE